MPCRVQPRIADRTSLSIQDQLHWRYNWCLIFYDHKQVLSDYAHGKITPEMAVGHSLQHIDNLYVTQAAARTEWRAEMDALKKHLTRVEAAVDRLAAIIEKARAQQKSSSAPSQPHPEQPSNPQAG